MAEPAPAPWAMAFARRVRELRLLILVTWAILIVQGIGAMNDVRYDPDVLVYFDPAGEERQAFEAIADRFGQTNEVVTLVVPDEGTVYAPEPLRALARLTLEALARPEVTAVRSILSAVEVDPAALLRRSEAELRTLAEALEAAVDAAPDDYRPLVDEAGTPTAFAAILAAPEDNEEVLRLAAAHQALKDRVAGDAPGVTLMQTGRLVIDAAFLNEGRGDVTNFAGAQLAVLLALLFAALGSISLTLVMTVMVFAAVTPLLGWLGITGIAINGISSAAPAVLMGLTVATAIHIVLTWQDALRGGTDRLHAIAIAFERNTRPVLISIATTAISFLLLNVAEAPPFRQLGNLVAIGLLITLAAAFTLLPALLLLIPKSFGRHRDGFERMMARLGAAMVARRRAILALTGLVTVAAAWGASTVRIDDTFSHYFDDRYEVRRATDLFEATLSGTTIIDVAVDTGQPEGAIGAQALSRTAELTRWLAQQPEVARVESLATIAERAGDTPLLAAHRLAVAEGLPPLVSPDARHLRVSVVMRGVTSQDTIAFAARTEREAERLLGAGDVTVTGMPVLSAQLSIESARAMVVAMGIALAAISLLIMLTLRSLRLGAISLVPNLLPVLIAFGLWGAFAGEVSFAATVVGALTYGLVVDDTVHILSKYQRFAAMLPTREAMAAAFRSVGVAVVVTSIALGLSFLPFAFSGFLVNRHFGALTALTLGAALVADLLLLPALLAFVGRAAHRRS